MELNGANVHRIDTLGCSGPMETLQQIADLCQKVASIDLIINYGESTFYPSKRGKMNQGGILALHGKIADDTVILVQVELVRAANDIRVSTAPFFRHLSTLGEKTRLIPPREQAPGQFSLWVELKVMATPLSISRSSAFADELRHLDELARYLQAELPVDRSHTDLVMLYKGFEGTLAPVHPWCGDGVGNRAKGLLSWARETIDFLIGSSCVALASPFPILIDLALAAVAHAGQEAGRSLGRLLLPMINSRILVNLTRKAPGIVVVPAMRISLGTSPYELGNEMRALLASLSNANTPAIFTGNHEELQGIFHGGQGGANDPLFPILRHIPDVSLDILTRFMIQSAGQRHGGIAQNVEEEMIQKIRNSLKKLSPAEQRRFLPMVAMKTVNTWKPGKKILTSSSRSFASRLSGLSESLAGLPSRPRVKRSSHVQEHFTSALTDPGLLSFFQEYLLAQDKALKQLVARLRMECLTRPLHQPIRYCAQGTPATGKSESASLLAQRLGIPYVNIDAASMSDYHTAAAQLLGSGRGIVGSHQSGRLEQVAKHHNGAVVEVSDLDHASPSVRSSLGDLFLQVLETGEAQSSTGAMFSCANLIFAFTMNLPGGMDERVRKGVGFNNMPSRHDVSRRVVNEIKNMLSGAFLSRVGTPVLFEPMDAKALEVVVERALKKAVIDGAERMHCRIGEVVLDAGIGIKVITSLEANISSFGVRALLEHGRSLAAEAFIDLLQGNTSILGKVLFVSANSAGEIIIRAS